MAKFTRTQMRISTDFIRRLQKLKDRTGVDRSNHIRIAIGRYLEEEEMRLAAIKKMIAEESVKASSAPRKS